ncbi:MAG: hypothetical protein EA417_04445 [Gammaproteobacteria bacterium]|nr:MAG: hypothetical protein EA417_04445 [Gammaproteobacteria bacterium]
MITQSSTRGLARVHACRWLGTLVLAACAVAGCASAPSEYGAAPSSFEAVTVPANEPQWQLLEPAPTAVGPAFERDTLYELLVAELALRQGDHGTALKYYAAQARHTRDPGVVARAVRLATLERDISLALQMAELWVEVAPRDPNARQAAAVALIRANALGPALAHLAELRAQAGAANFGYLALQAAALEPDARTDLLAALAEVHGRFPDDPELAFAQAVLLDQERRPEAALALLEPMAVDDLPREAVLLKGRLLERLGRRDDAIDWFGSWIDQGDDQVRLRYVRARLLIDAGDLASAQSDFEAMLLRVGDNPEILLSIALLAAEQNKLTEARDYLQRLIATGSRHDVAHLYLGELAQAEGDVDAAVSAFRNVSPGSEFRSAQVRASALLLQHAGRVGLSRYMEGQRKRYPDEAVTLWLLEGGLLLEVNAPESALAVLDDALLAHPDDTELRYTRALARKRVDDIAGLEADLRHVLAREPRNAMALNALGYVLADRTDRFQEAKELIEQALAMRPDEPAYIDSLGWVEYRLGNHARALELLEQAYAAMPDHEVAAHLGEVLWVTGDSEAAVQVWTEGLELEPDSRILAETMQRLLGTERALGVRSSVEQR